MPLTNNGEEFCLKYIYDDAVTKPATVYVGLFLNDPDEGGDDLGVESELADITTEPDDAETYEQQSISFSETDFTTVFDDEIGHWKAIFEDVAFDVQDNTEDIDAFFLLWDVDDDGVEELVAFEQFENLYNLDTIGGSFVLSEAGKVLLPCV